MSVPWFAVPSARPNGGTAGLWKERGYRVALSVDEGKNIGIEYADLMQSIMPYPGYAESVNCLCRLILAQDPDAEWIVTGGDDTEPDPNHTPEEIASECSAHFGTTFGVMQPTGDRFAQGSIDRIAGSPWMGREWCQRAHGGAGPLWPEFTHMFVDEALQGAAERLGVYWHRPDLIHLHHHFMRETDALDSRAIAKPIPAHLKRWNTRQHWDESKAIFDWLKAQQFAPCLPRSS
jgi:hypothetical protein